VFGKGHPGQRGHRFSLASGCDQDQLVRGVAVDLVDVDQRIRIHVDVAERIGRVEIVEHASPDQGDFTALLFGCGEDLLDAEHVR